MISILALLCLLLAGTDAVDVSIPPAAYEVARGKNITVPCTFKPVDTTKLVLLEWSNFADQVDAEENPVIIYYPSDGSTDVGPDYTGRASLDVDLPSGKFNLKLSSVTLNDNKKFKCHVQAKSDPSKSLATTRVVVLVAPTPPLCNIQGKAEYGQNINLTCASQEGSPPPTYKWKSLDVQNNPRPFDPKTTDQGGILSLFNVSKDTSGLFICTSANKIGSSTCNFTLAVMPPSMNIGSTAGIVAGVAIALLLFAVIIYCCCCRKKNKEEEYAMGVHEDEYHDKDLAKNGDGRHADGQEEVRTSENTYVKSAPDRHDEYEERSERGNNRDYKDRRSDYDDRRSDYDDRRSDYKDRRSDYDDRRSDYDDRRSDYSDRRDKYSDRNERYNDNRRDDRKDRRYDDDRYDEPYDDRNRDRPQVPSNKPQRRNYDN